jgi:hypothetical protein
MARPTVAPEVRAQASAPAASATVTGQAWHDRNGDRVRQPDEAPIAGAEVLVILPGANGLPVTVRTDATGAYRATVPVGAQQVCFTFAGDGLALTSVTVAGDAGLWVNANGGNCSNVFTAVAMVESTVDATYRRADDPRLAFSGSATTDLVALGLVLLAAGGALLNAARGLRAPGR